LTPNGIAQIKFFSTVDEIDFSKEYWKNIAKHFQKNNDFVPGKHRLELIIPEGFSEISTEQLKNTIDFLRKIIQSKE